MPQAYHSLKEDSFASWTKPEWIKDVNVKQKILKKQTKELQTVFSDQLLS